MPAKYQICFQYRYASNTMLVDLIVFHMLAQHLKRQEL